MFVTKLEYGVNGIALATTITSFSTLSITICNIVLKKDCVRPNSWHWFNKDSFKGIKEYLSYGIPSMLMLILELLLFEILMILSGCLGSDQQGASITMITITAFFYMVSIGISIAAATLVGNNLGANKPRRAKVYTNMVVVLTIIIPVFFSIFVFLYSEEIASIFTKHENVKRLLLIVLPYLSIFMVADYMQGATSGIIRGMGYQKVATYG